LYTQHLNFISAHVTSINEGFGAVEIPERRDLFGMGMKGGEYLAVVMARAVLKILYLGGSKGS
jgi:hypothetical protein